MEHTLEAVELRCESRRDPIGIDTERPRFSWGLDAGGAALPGRARGSCRSTTGPTIGCSGTLAG